MKEFQNENIECHDECCREHHHDECLGECCHEHHHEECHDECCHEHHHEECHDECCHEHHHEECHDGCCHHEHGGCACCAAKGKIDLEHGMNLKADKKKLALKISVILVAVVLAIIGTFIPNETASMVLFIIAYVVAGYEYFIKAAKNITRGEIFDENFLMIVASVGAMIIGEMREGILVMVLFGIGEMLEDFALRKSKGSIASLMSLKQDIAHILRDGNYVDIATDALTIGDTILVKSGEAMPVDGVVVEGNSTVDNSAITGESMPIAVASGDEVVAGSINNGDSLVLRVTKEYKDTTIKKIIDIVSNAENHKPKSQKMITKFAKYYTPTVVLIAVLVAVIPSIITGDVMGWVHKALVFLVISCPCAIVISVPLAIFSGIGGASRKGVLIKGGNILENLHNVNVVAFDKTGTLTTGDFAVSEVVTDMDREKFLDIVSGIESYSSHPIAKNIVAYHASNMDINAIDEVSEIKGKGMTAVIDGTKYYVGNASLMLENNVAIDAVNEDDRTIIYVSDGEKLLGYVALEDRIKDGACELIAYLKARKIDVVMLTGDRESVAQSVAHKLGIDTFHASLLPEDKNSIISGYVSEGKRVMFVGDGINDAPALTSADIGVVNNNGSNDISKEAGDIILMSGSINEMMGMFASSRKTKRIVVENIVFSLLIKLAIALIDVTIYPSMWLAVIADVGVTIMAILNAIRALK